MRVNLLISVLAVLVGSTVRADFGSDAQGPFGDLDPTLSASALYATQPGLALGPAYLGADDDQKEKESGPDYLALRAGPLWFTDDLDSLDTGASVELAFGYRFIRILSVEIQTGYFGAEDSSGSTEVDVFGVPFVLNARLALPIPLVHPYVGAGLGGYYVNADVKAGGFSQDDDDFIFGGNIFAGIELKLGPVSAGLEVKYVKTQDADLNGAETNFDYLAVLVSVALRL